MNFCILPAGAWGTAMAIHLARNNHTVTLVPRTLEEALDITAKRENLAFFPGFTLDTNIQIGSELKPALMEAEVVILACPTKFLRNVCREIRAEMSAARRIKIFITLCKGLESGTNKLPGQILEEEIPDYSYGVLSGPTFASQVARGKPSAIVLAAKADTAFLAQVQYALSDENFRVYTSDDLIGTTLGGCLKNVYAIASGICDGLELGDNTKAALLTRSLAEMVRLGVALGGKVETFYGLSGIGDLVLTCNGKESRNRTFGDLFARGNTIDHLINEKQMTVEGYLTSACFHNICVAAGIDAPILGEVYKTLYQGKTPLDSIRSLMTRELKPE